MNSSGERESGQLVRSKGHSEDFGGPFKQETINAALSETQCL